MIKLIITSRKTNFSPQYNLDFVVDFFTTDALLYATEKMRLNLDNKKMVASALLDLSKAFDSISHNLLFAKLKSFNFDTSAINMRESYLKTGPKK